MNPIARIPNRLLGAALVVTVAVTLAATLTTPASAQEPEKPLDAETMKKKMAEISRLMRESERLLLEMTKADRLVQQQRQIVEELKKLEQPKAPTGSETRAEPETDATKTKRKELQQRQREIRERMEKLFENQENAANLTEQLLVYLLRNLPRGGLELRLLPSPGHDSAGQKESNEKKDEQKSNDPNEQKAEDGDSGSSREREKKKKRDTDAQIQRYQSWVARLPRAQQERISRGDFSGFPPRYRRLLREYTRLRAEREVEHKRETPSQPR